MELIVISAPGIAANEAQVINRLFEAGLERFHLRKPGWDIGQCIDLLTQINRSYHPAIVCHQHHHLIKAFGMRHMHYTENDRLKTSRLKLDMQIDEGYLLSTSVHDVNAISQLQNFEYTFFSPVFNSISKLGYQSILPDSFCLDKSKPGPKVIALGGVDESNLHRVKAMNFDGAAVLGAIWNKPEQAVSNFLKIKRIADQLN